MVSHRRFGRSNRDRIVRISNLIGQTFHRNFSNTFVFELHGEVLYINLRTWSRSKNVQQFCLRYSCRQPRYFIPLVLPSQRSWLYVFSKCFSPPFDFRRFSIKPFLCYCSECSATKF